MKAKGAVVSPSSMPAKAASLGHASWLCMMAQALLLAGCADAPAWPRMCAVFTDCEVFPSEQVSERLKPSFPSEETFQSGPSKKTIDRYRSDECGEKCARRRAERDHEIRRATREYDERINRDWIPADDPRRWQ